MIVGPRAVADRGSDSYPLRLDFFNTLGPTEQIFVDGQGNVLDPQIAFGEALVTHLAGTNKPLIEKGRVYLSDHILDPRSP